MILPDEYTITNKWIAYYKYREVLKSQLYSTNHKSHQNAMYLTVKGKLSKSNECIVGSVVRFIISCSRNLAVFLYRKLEM